MTWLKKKTGKETAVNGAKRTGTKRDATKKGRDSEKGQSAKGSQPGDEARGYRFIPDIE